MPVRIEISAEALDVRVAGADRFFGMRSHVEVPMGRVVAARTMPAGEAKSDLLIRTGGLGLPGVAAVGHFRGRTAKKQWWRAYRADELLVIDLAPESLFDRLVLQVDDPGLVAERINRERGTGSDEAGAGS